MGNMANSLLWGNAGFSKNRLYRLEKPKSRFRVWFLELVGFCPCSPTGRVTENKGLGLGFIV